LGPLGEGSGKDPDPLLRYDQVDCVTFVETTMALSYARSADEVEPTLTRIRYGRAPTYDDRNHLMEAQWVPNNVAKGYVVDVTSKVGGKDVVKVSKTFTDATWASDQAKGLGVARDHQVRGTFSWPMIPLESFARHADAIPNGTLVLIVRKDSDDKITRVSHVGLIVREGGKTVVRHASSQRGHVINEPVSDFVERNAQMKSWPVEGFSLYEIQAPPAR
jgi:hypothetical protein